MFKNHLFRSMLVAAITLSAAACKKTVYSFGDIVTPTGLALTVTVAGQNAANPGGNGTGSVSVTASAKDAITYKIDFGDGKSQMVPSGTITYKYSNPGTADYVVTVNAIGTGGTISTLSKKIKVFVAFEIPAALLQELTNGSSKTWVCDKDASGHFGVGPGDGFSPIWYAADPNSRDQCSYDDEITFTKEPGNTVSMKVDNKGFSFIIAASAPFYAKPAGEVCADFDLTAVRKLSFMDATSTSTSANSTRIQFTVPGNGLLIFGTGGTTYEILSITSTTMSLRNIGADGNAWYQKLKAK